MSGVASVSTPQHRESIATSAPRLSCQQLVIGYGGRGIAPAIDIELRTGELTVVVGRNGSGKSTWMRTMLGLLAPVSGQVRRASPSPRLTYVPQVSSIDGLLPVRARELVGWSRLRGWSFLNPLVAYGHARDVRRALERAGAEHVARREFRSLSGGEKARVLFARVLAADAELAFLDEPTAAMDLASERDAYRQIAELAHQQNLGVVLVSHTISLAAADADQVLFLDPGDRRGDAIACVGSPADVFAHPVFRRHFGDVLA